MHAVPFTDNTPFRTVPFLKSSNVLDTHHEEGQDDDYQVDEDHDDDVEEESLVTEDGKAWLCEQWLIDKDLYFVTGNNSQLQD